MCYLTTEDFIVSHSCTFCFICYNGEYISIEILTILRPNFKLRFKTAADAAGKIQKWNKLKQNLWHN